MELADRRMLHEFAARVRERQPHARVWAFGSRARGDAAPDSDLDLCVVVPQEGLLNGVPSDNQFTASTSELQQPGVTCATESGSLSLLLRPLVQLSGTRR